MIGALGIAGCASTPTTDPVLEDARTAVHVAEADPNVATFDPLDLQQAQKFLAAAETAAAQHHTAEIQQPAYMAGQTARLAQARASAKADDARVAAGQAERDQIRLASRERELQSAQQAKQAAQQAQQAADQNALAADAKASQLQGELDQLKASQTARGLVLTLGDVLFATGKADLAPGSARKLSQLSQFLINHKDRRVEIDGFTDNVGSDSYNEVLSQERAAAVKSVLISQGVDPSRIDVEGFGKSFPVASNSDSAGRQMNRRVEVVIGGENNSAIAPRS
jgi:outer membrane protein OmpA-like peptidoglycan-associated protein